MLSSKKVKATVVAATLVLGMTGTVLGGAAHAATADNVLMAGAQSADVCETVWFTEDEHLYESERVFMGSAEMDKEAVHSMLADYRISLSDAEPEFVQEPSPDADALNCEIAATRSKGESNKEMDECTPISEVVETLIERRGSNSNHYRPYTGGTCCSPNKRGEMQACTDTDNHERLTSGSRKSDGNDPVKEDEIKVLTLRSTRDNYFRAISLSAGSYSRGKISISTMVTSRYLARRIGIRSIRLQRYQNSRWMTVQSWSNSYRRNTDRYSFSTTANNLVSGDMYRIVATYTLRNNNSETATVMRTSAPLVCR